MSERCPDCVSDDPSQRWCQETIECGLCSIRFPCNPCRNDDFHGAARGQAGDKADGNH